jgi:very-short-patch-repair endonuclease
VPRKWHVWTRSELMANGWTARGLTAAVRGGRLVRARENAYLHPDAPEACRAAATVGGRLTCVSELARWGVFVWEASEVHVAVPATSSRLRTTTQSARVHWTAGKADGWSSTDLVDALILAVVCQPVRAAIATLDSALHLGLIRMTDLDDVFDALPRRYRVLRRHVDSSAESGSETFMRLMLERLGCSVETQVRIRGVGRVDFVVDGWLLIECDSKAHHAEWKTQVEDRRRDQAAAALGYATYRPIAADIFWNPDQVVAAVRGLLSRAAARS